MKRPRGKAGSNLRLPESVLGEIKSGHSESDNHNINYQNKFKSRKEERKRKRQKIKQQNIKRNASKSIAPPIVEKPKPKKKEEKKKKEIKATIIPEDDNQMSRAEFEEERYMQLLEKKLKIKSTNFLNSFSGDGLDFLLEGIELGSKKLRGDPSSSLKKNKQEKNIEKNEVSSSDTENEDEDESEVDDEDDEDEDGDEISEDNENLESEDEDEESELEEEINSDDSVKETPKAEIEEPKPVASVVSKYVPPHLRQSNDENAKIKKLVQGLINRLAENNLESTLLEIDGFYRDYSRNSVSTSVTEIVLLSISNHSHLSDSLVVVNSGLVAGLYRIAGIEFAANFVQSTVEKFNQYHEEIKLQETNNNQSEDIGKECSNLISLISELYNFNVIACNLIYDLIRMFLGSLNEQNVELLLKLLRSIGHQLRTDDPTAMKEIYLMAVAEMKNHPTLAQKSRVKFMMETMSDLKNNKFKKQGSANSGDSIMQRIKTFLKNLEKKFNRGSIEALRVSLDDINNVKTKGKWWLVGASWVGVQYDPNESKSKSDQHKAEQKKNTDELTQLAKQQSMNTEIRKAIFTVLMSSNDFIDAYERIMKLNLTSVQQREIVRVLAHCCGNEKVYNPYYKFVCAKFCQYDHSYKITLQYCLWDFCRELGDNSVGGMGYHSEANQDGSRKKVPLRKIYHMSKFYGDLMAQGALSINAFKGLTLTRIQMIPSAKLFFILFFCQYLAQALANEDNQQLLTNGLATLSAANPTVVQEITLFLNLHITNSEIFDQLNQSEKTKISQAIALVNTAERSKLTRLIE